MDPFVTGLKLMDALSHTEFAFRGDAYIDGIAKTFESRNYFALIVSFVTALTIQLVDSKVIWINVLCGAIVGFIVLFVLNRFSKGKTVGDIADVKEGLAVVVQKKLIPLWNEFCVDIIDSGTRGHFFALFL
jgi:hypothetical protein